MHLVPTQEEVLDVLRRTGGLKQGHFEYQNGVHTNEYLQVPLSMRYFDTAKILSVGLSRLLRAHADIRAVIPELSIVAPATGGMPVAYGVCEALRARQVYWAERNFANGKLGFRQFLEIEKGEKVFLVDDILRTGNVMTELKALVEERGAEVMGIAVVVHQPTPGSPDFSPLPFYCLTQWNHPTYYANAAACDLCAQGVPCEKILL